MSTARTPKPEHVGLATTHDDDMRPLARSVYDACTMITRIEIDGFKSFTDFALDLEPFTVIAGVNGVGKSNLFDALRHLRRLVGGATPSRPQTLRAAFESPRGSLADLFTRYPDGSRARAMTFGVELLLPGHVTDPYGVSAEVLHRRVRYELEVTLDGPSPRLVRERLAPISRKHDRFLGRYPSLRDALPKLKTGRTSDFVSTEQDRIVVHQDRKGGRKHPIPLAATTSTALSSISDVTFPHAFATREALVDLRFLQLEPRALRAPSPFAGSTELGASGEGLAATMARIEHSDPRRMKRISHEVAHIVPGISCVEVNADEVREEWSVQVRHVAGDVVPAQLVSDGTLRLIALATLTHDPDYRGTLVLEEPENGVYAGRIDELLQLLRGFVEGVDAEPWARQLLVNTHSIPLIKAMRTHRSSHELLFAYLKRVARQDHPLHRATTIAAVAVDGVQERLFDAGETQRRVVAFHEMERLLRTADADMAETV